ncbi:MAG: hypothetical protein CR997_12475 [Acidobacteria bacterium]|nr:MAG: hypothetical protein CR997_12475 [Acidobacteriota bacterium]
MHLNLEDFNLLLEQKITKDERLQMLDHMLNCDACTVKYKMLLELKQEMVGNEFKERHPWRYALGAAAVLLLASFPYFGNRKSNREIPHLKQPVASTHNAAQLHGFSLIEEIQEINYKSKISNWGSRNTVQDILKAKNNS